MSQNPVETIMNDDCVTEVFERLNLDNLLNVCRVSKQFKRAARTVFSMKYRKLKPNIHVSSINEDILLTLFRNFGDLIESIEIPLGHPRIIYKTNTQKFFIMLIKNYCSKEKVKLNSLKICYFDNIGRYLHLMSNIFVNLKTLHLQYVALPFTAIQLINKMPLINDLNLTFCIPILPMSTTFRPTVNLNLDKLTLRCRNKLQLLDILLIINDLYPNLSELRFQIIGYIPQIKDFIHAIPNIGLLQRLKKLDIDIECEKLDLLLSNLTLNKNQIQHLCIRFAEITPNAIKQLTEMNSLNELIIMNTLSRQPINIAEIVLKLPNLTFISAIDAPISMRELNIIVFATKNLTKAEFKMKDSIMNETILKSIISTVEKRENHLPLKVILHVNGVNELSEYNEFIQRNKISVKLLHIILTHRGINELSLG